MPDQVSANQVLGKRSHSAMENKESTATSPDSDSSYVVDFVSSGSLQDQIAATNAAPGLDAIGVVELLNQDPRPTFVLDLDPDCPSEATSGISPIFCNSSLHSYDRLRDLIMGNEDVEAPAKDTANTYDEFRMWATSMTTTLTFAYADMFWIGSLLRKRWRIISGTRSDIFAGISITEVPVRTDSPSSHAPKLDSKPCNQQASEQPDSVPQKDKKEDETNFVDIASHEIRNPLSAILQSADDITQSLKEYLASSNATISEDVVKSCIEAAEIISLCGQYQKSIVDDLLTASKLDSNLLLITPIEAQPVVVAQSAINMLDSELQKSGMTMHLNIHQSYKDLEVDWALFDPGRLLQVLINLVTNAIKFTRAETERRLVVSVSASREQPLGSSKGFDYIPAKNPHLEIPLGDGWGSGELLFLRFEVNDTGRGLNDDEKKLLFKRFSQASPRTHIQYGGSGLGLFICRQITELHGGMIGVASEVGIGSTFAFFIKARRPTSNTAYQSFPPTENKYPSHELWSESAQLVTRPPLQKLYSSAAPISDHRMTINLQDLHILLVEDNPVNQGVLRKQLEKLGCAVAVANHGQEALDYLEGTEMWAGNESNGKKLSLVLLDVEMPLMDGFTCIKCIRNLEQRGQLVAHVPVIAVTANARAEQISTVLDSGMDSIVSKPFRVAQLVTKIEALLLGGNEDS